MKRKFIFVLLVLCAAALGAQTLDEAILGAATRISRDLPAGATAAVINFRSGSEELNEYVLNGLYGALLRTRRLTLVQPNQGQFRTIRSVLGASGEPDAESALSIGELLGAQHLITGSLEQAGNIYSITFTAFDTGATMQSQYTATLNPRNDSRLALLLRNQSSASSGSQSSGSQSASASQPKPVTISVISGVSPGTGKVPARTIDCAQYSGTVTWSPEVPEVFERETQYTATITVTVKTGFTLMGVEAGFFSVSGAETTSNNANSGVITAVFPLTGESAVSIANIEGVPPPLAGKIPVTEIIENAQYGGTVTWSPEVSGAFEMGISYTATITLNTKPGFSLQGIDENFFIVAGSRTSNEANSGIVTAQFAPTKDPTDAQLWSVGASLGTSFGYPWIMVTVHGTLAPFAGSFFEIGFDCSLFSNSVWPDVFDGYGSDGTDRAEYFSLYPYINYALFLPFARSANGKKGGGWYAGAGIGVLFAQYTFETVGPVWDTVFAVNVLTGFRIGEAFDISFTLRTNFKSADIKLALGYSYRFK
jgi:hypothetical protein